MLYDFILESTRHFGLKIKEKGVNLLRRCSVACPARHLTQGTRVFVRKREDIHWTVRWNLFKEATIIPLINFLLQKPIIHLCTAACKDDRLVLRMMPNPRGRKSFKKSLNSFAKEINVHVSPAKLGIRKESRRKEHKTFNRKKNTRSRIQTQTRQPNEPPEWKRQTKS